MQRVDENAYKTKVLRLFLALHGRFVTSGLNGDLRKSDLSHKHALSLLVLKMVLFMSATKVINGNKY